MDSVYYDDVPYAALACGGAAAVFAFIIGIAAYVFTSLGLMTLAKNKGIENAWLAWIPIGNLYILGKIVKNVKIGSWEIPQLEVVLPIASVAVAILSFIPVLGFLIAIAAAVLSGFVLYKLFSMYRPEQAVLFTVLSFILGLFWIFVFIIRNDQAQEEYSEFS